MQIIVILILFGAFFASGLCRGFAQRRGENIYYISAMAVSLVVLILKAADLLTWNPTKALYGLFYAFGLVR